MTVKTNPKITLAWDALKSPEMQKALGQLGQFANGPASVLGSTVAASTLAASHKLDEAHARKLAKMVPASGLVPEEKLKQDQKAIIKPRKPGSM